MDLKNISVTMLTKNSEKHLKESLESLKAFGEVLVLDNGSKDQTQTIAQSFSNVTWKEHPFLGFGFMKNKAAEWAKYDWVFNVDSDEVLTQNLLNQLSSFEPSSEKTVISVSRLNHYDGKLIKACGWYPDRVLRLYNKQGTSFNNNQVHEKILHEKDDVAHLTGEIKHYSFDSAEELVNKMNHYSSLYAKDKKDEKKGGAIKATIRSLMTFIKNYFFKKGILYGREGFLISACQAGGVFFKYIKLAERQKELKK